MIVFDQKKLYLVTGFLGAGKTTLMQELFHIFSNQKIGVIINEFGKAGIDGIVLQKEGLEISEISNGSIFCSCRSDLFIDALIEVQQLDVDVVLVESSGLADPTGMPEILKIVQKMTNNGFDYRGVVGVVDAQNFHKLLKTAVAVEQQIVSSHLILINKIDLVDEEMVVKTQEMLQNINPNAIIKKTTFCKVDPKWITNLDDTIEIHPEKLMKKRMIGSQKLLIKIEKGYSVDQIKNWIGEFAEDTYRIKGFIELEDGWYHIEGVGTDIQIQPTSLDQQKSALVILASGNKPVKDKISQSWSRYFQQPLNMEQGM